MRRWYSQNADLQDAWVMSPSNIEPQLDELCKTENKISKKWYQFRAKSDTECWD